jgi:hypothetical protein
MLHAQAGKAKQQYQTAASSSARQNPRAEPTMHSVYGSPAELRRTLLRTYARTADALYCNAGCAPGDECCPRGLGLSPSDALDNADSFACFAERLYPGAI